MTSATPAELIRAALNGQQQRVIAKAAGISPAYLGDIVHGKRLPPPSTLVMIALALKIDSVPLMWAWLAQQVGDEMVDAMIAAPPATAEE